MAVITKQDLLDGLSELGLKQGDKVIVHTSLRSLGYVCGGAQAVIEALIETVGYEGTIVMPTQSWKNLDPTEGVHWTVPKSEWQKIRDNWPAYDKNITPTNTMGTVAEMFRSWPGVIRSDHPARSMSAWGADAEYIMVPHTLTDIFGDGSPLGRLYDLHAQVLLIGVGYDKNTSLHLADARANYGSKHMTTQYSAIMENGKRIWKGYDTLYVDGDDFEQIGACFEKDCTVKTGRIGDARVRLMDQRALVDYAVKWIEKNR